MKTFDIKKEGFLWLVMLVPVIFTAIFWDKFPAKIPMHFNAAGEVDNWGGKGALFIGPGVSFALYFMLLFIPNLDPKKANYENFRKGYYVVRVAFHIFMTGLSLFIIAYSLGMAVKAERFVPAAVCLLFMVIGNQMGNFRHNYFVGIRTPWTLENEEVWKKTHRVSGRVWVISSLIMLLLVFLLPDGNAISVAFIAYVILIVIFSLAYSFAVSKKVGKG
ncbi:MAG: SdpI family protein [Bacteroidia bacterium]